MPGLKDRLVARALEEGFDLAKLCRPWHVGHVPDRLRAFLDKGYQGQTDHRATPRARPASPSARDTPCPETPSTGRAHAPHARVGTALQDRTLPPGPAPPACLSSPAWLLLAQNILGGGRRPGGKAPLFKNQDRHNAPAGEIREPDPPESRETPDVT